MTDPTRPPIALETRIDEGGKLMSPSVGRNREPIAAIFGRWLAGPRSVLELGSGTGEHAAHICAQYHDIVWQPSDPDPRSRESIDVWAREVDAGRMRGAMDISADGPWWEEIVGLPVDTLVSINMIHIAPFEAAEGLFTGAGRILPQDGGLFLYGPFFRNGDAAPSNVEFDRSLKERNPAWGVRNLDLDLLPLAQAHGLSLAKVAALPANNLAVLFVRR